jgi:acyl-coenzyme A synthetase/AMP-(fatty) acid ligase
MLHSEAFGESCSSTLAAVPLLLLADFCLPCRWIMGMTAQMDLQGSICGGAPEGVIFGCDGKLELRQLHASAQHLARMLPKGTGGVGCVCEEPIAALAVMLASWLLGRHVVLFEPVQAGVQTLELAEATGVNVIVRIKEERYRPGNADIVELRTSSGDKSDIAYVAFTSGTTGKPNAVAIGWQALEARLMDFTKRPGVSEVDKIAALASPFFDMSIPELLLPYVTGCSIVSVTARGRRIPERLMQEFRELNPTILQATPTMLRVGRPRNLDAIPSATRVWTGGEPVPVDIRKALAARDSDSWNLYGPTEATMVATAECVDEVRPGCIGSAFRSTEWSIGGPQPIGDRADACGELWLSGPGLGLGYIDREGVIDHRAWTTSATGQRWYRTGDVCRVGADGLLYFEGRTDAQCQVGGARIELVAVEDALTRYPGVQASLVVPVHGDNGQVLRLAAFVIADGTVTTRALRSHMRSCLPPVAVPATYQFVETFARTSRGKIKRRVYEDLVRVQS